MRKNSLFMLLMAILTFLSPSAIKAQTWSATWPFNLGTAGQVATLSEDNLFSLNVVSIGSNLSYYSTRTEFNTTFTLIQPSAKASGDAETDAVTFSITPQKGVEFTPTAVSFDAVRIGTGGGNMDVYLKSGDQSILLGSFLPNRNSSDYEDASHPSYTVEGITTSDAISLVIYIYSLDNNKQVGIANVSISGTYTGEPEEVTTYTFSTAVSPEGAATIAQSPIGSTFNEGTSIALSVTENLGYDFVNWTDNSGTVVSTEPDFSYVLNSDVVLTANFATVETYSLSVDVVGGANDYMVTLSPEPTVVDGNNLYEAGTNVMLSASDNPILTFTHWSTGETSKEISVKMDEDINITANYDAVDYIVGWDFYNSGSSSRIADFYSDGNDATSLVLRNAEGTISSWLDKSTVAAGGYEGMPAAVNWKTTGLGDYYFQTMVNAEAFTQINVTSSMLYNYNAYQKVNVDYSINGDDWTTVGTIYMQTNKVWYTETFTLPEEANNQAQLYIRWIADTSSEIAGTSSDNDGTSISAIYIVGTKQIIDDGTAPALVSQVPEEGATNASISGKIVLTFDEKVQVLDDAVATLGDKSITPTATGKTVTCEYSGLEYTHDYTFTLPAGTVADLSGNATTEDIIINFTTKTRPVVEKGSFDFIVPTDGSFADAITAATKRSDTNVRFRIFVKKGSYLLEGDGGTNTGSDDVTYTQPTTNINTPNISIIGEDRDSTILY
ncbi:MAG: Ig-like domain-containing protein, partial [Porphyromonadaceae bacterium]|nr:Ig-like domain-containing protein [Porphyromonadaceae bacterium]